MNLEEDHEKKNRIRSGLVSANRVMIQFYQHYLLSQNQSLMLCRISKWMYGWGLCYVGRLCDLSICPGSHGGEIDIAVSHLPHRFIELHPVEPLPHPALQHPSPLQATPKQRSFAQQRVRSNFTVYSHGGDKEWLLALSMIHLDSPNIKFSTTPRSP